MMRWRKWKHTVVRFIYNMSSGTIFLEMYIINLRATTRKKKQRGIANKPTVKIKTKPFKQKIQLTG